MKKRRWKWLFLICLATAVILAGGINYVSSVMKSLWMQSVTDTLEVTSQGAHSFEVYIQKDMELLHGLAVRLSQRNSDDEDTIVNLMQSFGDMGSNYIVANLDKEIVYSSQSGESVVIDENRMAVLEALSGSGIKEPYISADTGQRTLGFYECFNFADGARGVIRKEQLLSDVSDEFSLSFYDNTGFSYIVDKEGNILIRSAYKNSNRTFSNLFDIIDLDGNSNTELEDFKEVLVQGKSGVARFTYDSDEYVYAYVPIEYTDGWYLVSIIPNRVIMKHAGEIMGSMQIFALLLVTIAFFAILFVILLHQNKKRVMEKESEILYREQLFNILANNTDEVFVMFTLNETEKNYQVEYVSPNVERVLGITDKEILEKLDMLDGGHNDGNDETYFERLCGMQPDSSLSEEQERIHKKSGERRWFMETVYRVTINDTDKFILTISDRTVERQRKEALEQALAIAEVANQSKSTFLSNMSHDIRTPMNAIIGLCTLLQRDVNDPERVYEHTRKITASSQHLLALINDVLDMSKIEAGKTTLNITEINLADIVEELGTIIRAQAAAKQQTFEISAHDVRSEHLLGDKLRINQILINILSNAVKYTGVGGHIEMIIHELPQTTKNYARLRFIIKDDGMGMSEEYIEEIFQPFTREINSTTNKIQGTGLGMAITKNLVDLMGGTISLESRLGEGSKFTVNLELRIQEKDIDESFWQNHGVTRLLVIDDDKEVCDGVMGAMARTGVFVQAALSGRAAIELVEKAHKTKQDFDLILLDWRMPDMDGLETARRIRTIIPSNVPLMILTAYDWSDIEKEAAEAGINGFLPKPFFITNFKQTIEKLDAGRAPAPNQVPDESVLHGRHILAAEDNPLNSEILVELMSMVGAECEVVENGKLAVEKFAASEAGQYDLILMDIQMPVMNGYEAARAIRACGHPLASEIPIIAMTANAFAEDVKNALDAGMDAHVAKPVDMDHLERTIRDILSRKWRG